MNIKSIFTDEDFISLLKQIKGQSNKFNVFNVLGQSDYEIRHSNVISWLLTPNESHGLKEYFINRFIAIPEILNKHNISIDVSNVAVFREKYLIDIIIEDHKKKVVIAIENKFWSPEGIKQLLKYRKKVEEEYKEYKRYYIFLTPLGTQPSSDEEHWVQISYKDVQAILQDIIDKKTLENQNVHAFLQMYLELINRRLFGSVSGQNIVDKLIKKYDSVLNAVSIDEIRQKYLNYINEVSNGNTELYFDALQEIVNRRENIPIILRDYIWDNCISKIENNNFRRINSIGFSTKGFKKVVADKIDPKMNGYVFFYLIFHNTGVNFLFSIYPPNKEVRSMRNDMIKWIRKNPPPLKFANRMDLAYYIIYEEELMSKNDFMNYKIDEIKTMLSDKVNEIIKERISIFEKYLKRYSKTT